MSLSEITFGPVPSRRLGRSLGINNIPPKICSYSCVYCQVGLTSRRETKPCTFFHPKEISQQVEKRVDSLCRQGERVDYLTFVPDGEPTLDNRLEETIELLRPLGIRIAVITNASLLGQPMVKRAQLKADWVSVKIDSVDTRLWRKINRPPKQLQLDMVLRGIQVFADEFEGTLVSETMLLEGLNDKVDTLTETAEFIANLSPQKAYLAIPTRPPAEKWVKPPSHENFLSAYQTFQEKISNTECLIEYEGEDFVAAGNIRDEMLRITSVHPLREEAVAKLLSDASAGPEVIDGLMKEKKITMTEYRGKRFYLRNFHLP
ncbi:Wyosine [tRNA(Phe)-imidazoG37] synthetase, radical SAM superfamily [Malonomonas rubra DSM 5091]|uniref:Wyosine [tRNA(Phe)-imidazoG37] synthetase, radical SAM superfamily n=1 Tax=Malonomonas rubra DSM 5091 TaxID=1122189 RepID=A0A1M6NEL0_MALRU|nr:radical SAM protein [Malonomonas rubra]SHJ94168.1 Wyosine [tRNA(Phe)-imidazoG37] synthetase, radical SAM superfamily [Malonomonas rubra DSM 5091]